MNRYYQDELFALHELGREFAERNPALVPFLSTPGRDPDVERLLEGFAFLVGRLRQKLDDELPEITHSLFNLLWPNYLRPVPACSIIRCQPGQHISGSVTLPRGTKVASRPVDGTRCIFRTAYETEILPLRIAGQSILEQGDEVGIVLRFEAIGTTLDNLPLRRLRFFLAGENAIAHTIYHSMVDRVRETRIVALDEKHEPRMLARLGADALQPVGFREEEGLYPYPANTFPGYRILQEYFCFPEKFLFVELSGLDAAFNRETLGDVEGRSDFEIHFILKELPESSDSFRPDNWQLFCTPVVNLFSMDSSPLTMDWRQTEYRIVPDPRLPDHFAVYGVDRVDILSGNHRDSRRYLPFESFEYDVNNGAPVSYYRLRLRPSHKDGGTETYISFVRGEDASLPQVETISMELTCTNRLLPRALHVGDINAHMDPAAGMVQCANITPVTPPFSPPLEGDLLWRLLANMSLNYVALSDINALKAMISAYNFRAPHDPAHARMLDKLLKGMVAIGYTEVDRIYNGFPVRGARTRLALDQRAFAGEGGMYLFGAVLNEFFALYATVNSFHQLIVEEASCREEYRWAPRLGRVTL